MSKTISFFLLLTLILLLNGCSDEWDDLVDAISGSGDDNPTPIEEVAAATPVAATPVVATPVVAAPVMATEPEPESAEYESEFHHTSTGSSDGGKSLVLCPGQVMNFDSCSVGNVDIPYHGTDNGRHGYWNMREEPRGDIVCVKNGKSYKYKADSMMVEGSCG
jgi:hypothetical protein